MYVAYDQGLLGSGTQGAEALKKAQAALPPAIHEWASYVGWEVRTVQMNAVARQTRSLNGEEKTLGVMFEFQSCWQEFCC